MLWLRRGVGSGGEVVKEERWGGGGGGGGFFLTYGPQASSHVLLQRVNFDSM